MIALRLKEAIKLNSTSALDQHSLQDAVGSISCNAPLTSAIALSAWEWEYDLLAHAAITPFGSTIKLSLPAIQGIFLGTGQQHK